MKMYTERKLIALALVETKKYLVTSEETASTGPWSRSKARQICFAAELAGWNKLLDDIIMERLDGSISVSCWLTKHVEEARQMRDNPDRDAEWDCAVQDFRHRWVDSLIEEFLK